MKLITSSTPPISCRMMMLGSLLTLFILTGDFPGVQAQSSSSSLLEQDCVLVYSILSKMGSSVKTSDAKNSTDCCSLPGIKCSSTRVIQLDGGYGLKGPIPPEIGNLTGLTNLYLNNNKLNGTIPSTLGNLVNLDMLYLQCNQLTGPIPESLGNIPNLFSLYLHDNKLNGTIPDTLGKLSKNLYYLTLNNNQLSGSIPSSFGNLVQLRNLWLHYNQITGPVPSSLGNLVNMRYFWLNDNQLSGPIPDTLGNYKNALNVYLNNNKLSGAIPSSLGKLTGLIQLFLHDNQLTGTIPSSLGNLTNLLHLFLHNNQLTDFIPSRLGNAKSLQNLWLYNNQLSGYPSSLNTSHIKSMKLFPNPMSSVPYDQVVNVSSLLLSNVTWPSFLETPISLEKRQATSSSAPISVNNLLKTCNLNNVQSSLVPAACVAGVYQAYCMNPSNVTQLQQCQNAYDQAFSSSIFSALGAVCPAWKQGPLTSACSNVVAKFSYNYFIGVDPTTGKNVYLPLNSTHASMLVSSILASPKYAPCIAPFPACNWSTMSKS